MSASCGSRTAWAVLAALAVACTPADETETETAAEDGAAAETEIPEEVTEERLSGWNVQLDREDADPAGFQMVVEDAGFAVQTGPAGVAWRSVDLLEEGDYTVSARFTERSAPEGHREAYGIVVGGKHLESPDQQYTYFLVRGDGSYLVKRRDGESTSTLVDWTTSEDVQGVEAEGQENPNVLEVRVRGEEVEFAVNGSVVETLPADDVQPWGFAGIRVNHNLDVRVTEWQVQGAAAGAATGPGDGEPADTAAGGGG